MKSLFARATRARSVSKLGPALFLSIAAAAPSSGSPVPQGSVQRPGTGDRLAYLGVQASGVNNVAKVGSVYQLSYADPSLTLVYEIDVNSNEVKRGLLRVFESTTGIYPLAAGGPRYRDSQNPAVAPKEPTVWLTSPTALVSDQLVGQTVVLEYVAPSPKVGSTEVASWRYSIDVEGKALRIAVEEILGNPPNMKYGDGLGGFLTGANALANNESWIRIHGTHTIPITQFNPPGSGAWFYMSTYLDPLKSEASRFGYQAMLASGASIFKESIDVYSAQALFPQYDQVVQFGFETTYNESRPPLVSVPERLAPLGETIYVIVTDEIRDAFLAPDREPSPYRRQLSQRMVCLMIPSMGNPTPVSFAATQALLEMLSDWGVDETAPFMWPNWQHCREGGVAWYPARCEGQPTGVCNDSNDDMKDLAASAKANGAMFGFYMLFSGMKSGYPLHPPPLPPECVFPTYADLDTNPGDIAKDATGAQKSAEFGPPLSDTSMLRHVEREMAWLKHGGIVGGNHGDPIGDATVAYDINLAFSDVLTYPSPTDADGDHVDQDITSQNAKTLRQAVIDRKTSHARMAELVQGPVIGEGSFRVQEDAVDYLYGGYVDGNQRGIVTGYGETPVNMCPAYPSCTTYKTLSCAQKIALGTWPDFLDYAPTQWLVAPDYAWAATVPTQANFHAVHDRFWTAYEDCLYAATPQRAIDIQRMYELTYGFVGYANIFDTDPGLLAGKEVNFARYVSEYYLLNALQELYLNLPIETVEYRNGSQWLSLDEMLQASGGDTSVLKDPFLRLTFGDGIGGYDLRMYLNHGTTIRVVSMADLDWNPNDPLQPGSITFDLPEDGFLAHAPVDLNAPVQFDDHNFLCFSAQPSTANHRIDYCYAPGQWEYMDARGSSASFGGMPHWGYTAIFHFGRDLTILENPSTSPTFQASSNGSGVTLASLAFDPPTLALEVGDVAHVRVVALYEDALGNLVAWRDVTTILDSLQVASLPAAIEAAVTVDEAGAVRANLAAQTSLQATLSGLNANCTVNVTWPSGNVVSYGYGRRGSHVDSRRIPTIEIDGTPTAGQPLTVRLHGARPQTPSTPFQAILFADDDAIATVLDSPLYKTGTPHELAVAWVPPVAGQFFPVSVDAQGEASFVIPGSLMISGGRFSLQWIVPDAVANSIAFTAGARVSVP